MGRTSDARQRLIDAANDLIWEYSYGAITIDVICERAAVKKGSFYYFFDSKSELAAVAVGAWWTERKKVLERIFTSDAPPLSRLREYLEFVSRRQLAAYEQNHQVLGCPIYGLGSEISTQAEHLRLLVVEMIRCITAYFHEAIAEAQTLGHLDAGDAAQKAQSLSRYYAGVLMQARIENDPEPIRNLAADALTIIGAVPEAVQRMEILSDTSSFLTPAEPPAELATSN